MKNRKTRSKISAILLAFALVLQICIPSAAFAADKQDKLVIDEESTGVKSNWGTPTFEIAFQKAGGEGTETVSVIPADEEAAFTESTNIEINGKDFGSMASIGFYGKGWPGANIFRLEGVEALKGIKEFINNDELSIKLTTKDYGVIEFNAKNTLDEATRKEIAGEDEPTPGKSYKINTEILKENGDGHSMSNPMFIEEADVEEMGDNVKFTMYVAFPVPAFPSMGTDGTLKDFFIKYNGKKIYG